MNRRHLLHAHISYTMNSQRMCKNHIMRSEPSSHYRYQAEHRFIPFSSSACKSYPFYPVLPFAFATPNPSIQPHPFQKSVVLPLYPHSPAAPHLSGSFFGPPTSPVFGFTSPSNSGFAPRRTAGCSSAPWPDAAMDGGGAGEEEEDDDDDDEGRVREV